MDVNHQLFQLQFSPGFFPPDLRWRRRLHGSPRPHQCHLHQGQASPVGAESLEHWEIGPVEDVTAENKEFQLLKLTKWYSIFMDHHGPWYSVLCDTSWISDSSANLQKKSSLQVIPCSRKRWKHVGKPWATVKSRTYFDGKHLKHLNIYRWFVLLNASYPGHIHLCCDLLIPGLNNIGSALGWWSSFFFPHNHLP